MPIANEVLGVYAHLSDAGYRCSACEKTFAYKRTVFRHYKEIHVASDQKFACDICGHVFPQRRYLANHQRTSH